MSVNHVAFMDGPEGGEVLFSMMLRAPLVALDAYNSALLHAVDSSGIAKAIKSGNVATVCGAETDGLLPLPDQPDIAAPWPPRIKGLAPLLRCALCQRLTGNKRPRSETRRAEEPEAGLTPDSTESLSGARENLEEPHGG